MTHKEFAINIKYERLKIGRAEIKKQKQKATETGINMAIKKITSMMLAVVMTVSCAVFGAVPAFAESRGNPDGVYIRQLSSGTCTLASATMMLRQKSLNEGNPTWKNITQASVRKHGWVEGVGIKHSFTYYGIKVERVDLSGEDRREALLEALEEHPEGVEIYDRSVPHAVMVTRYDADEDIFYCADPGLSDQEMPLGDSWMKTVFSGADQEDIIRSIDCIWIITSYTMKSIASESEDSGSVSDSNDSNGNSNSAGSGSNENAGNSSNGSSDGNSNSGNTSNGSSNGSSNAGTSNGSVNSGLADDENSNGNSSANNGSGSGAFVTDDWMNGNIVSGNDALKDDNVSGVSGKNVFTKIRDYTSAGFSDVDLTEWYAPYVQSVYETGLMSGLSGVKAGTFGINGDMTLAQSITIASRIYSKYAGDNEQFNVMNGDSWIDPYIRYAKNNGIITAQTAASNMMDEPVSRAEFSKIMSSALGDSACTQINEVKNGYFKDLYEASAAGRAVYRLCRAGIITGDSHGKFNPESSISRAQVAAIVARITDESLRVKL